MPSYQLPHDFSNLTGTVPPSYLADNFNYLLNLIVQGGSTPQIIYSPPALTAPVSAGTAAGTATISGLSGGSWSMTPNTSFTVNSSTGAVTATTTVEGGTYTPTLAYSASVGGETITVSLQTSIVVSAAGTTPSADFSQSSNSMYVPALAA